jgi:Protein of unknown function (DUF998)
MIKNSNLQINSKNYSKEIFLIISQYNEILIKIRAFKRNSCNKFSMNLNLRQKKMILCVFYGCSFFIISTIIAMILYTGGNIENPDAPHYDFIRNFFSELGITKGHTGEPNLIPHILFSLSVLIAGLGLIPFFIAMPAFFTEKKGEKILSRFASSLAIPIALAYIGIGFTPANLYVEWHMIFVMIAFTGTVPILLIYTILLYRNNEIPRYISYACMIFLVLAFGYMLNLFFGVDSIIFQVVAQKIIIYTEMISMAIAGHGIAKVIDKQLEKNTEI